MISSSQNKKKWIIGILAGFSLVFYLLHPVLAPFFIAVVLAYLSDPLVSCLVRIKLSRTVATSIVFIIFILLILLLLIWLIPMLEHQIILLINKIPQMLAWIENDILPWISEQTGIKEAFNIYEIQNAITKNWQQASNIAGTIIKTITYSGYSLVTFFINLVVVPVVTFYLLRDWNKVMQGIRELLPRASEPLIVKLAKESNEVIGAFFRGQLLVMLSLGIYYSIALSLSGLQFALLLGIIIGLISVVPYLGFIVGIVVTTIITIFQYHDWLHLGYIMLVFLFGNILENYVLAPKLVGDRIGLHPVAVIFSVFAGAELYGFVGILLALPVAAVIMVLLRSACASYFKSDLYQ